MTAKPRKFSAWLLWLPIAAFIVLLCTLLVGINEYTIATSFDSVYAPEQIITGTRTLLIRYPLMLHLSIFNEPTQRPITAKVRDVHGAGVSGPYTVTFTPLPALIFKNAENTEIAPSLSLYADGDVPPPRQIFLEVSPLATSLPPTITLFAHAYTPDGGESSTSAPLIIRLENITELRTRLIATGIIGALAALTFIFGLIFNVLARFDDRSSKAAEQATKEQSAQIAAIQTLYATNPLAALHEWHEAELRAKSDGWTESQLIDLQNIRSQLVTRRVELLRQINQLCRTEQLADSDIAQYLNDIGALFQGEATARRLAVIRPIFVSRPVSDPVDGSEVIRAVVWLWQQYSERLRAIVIYGFLWARRQHETQLEQQVVAAFKNDRSLRRLASDPHFQSWENINLLIAHEYQWPDLLKNTSIDTPEILKFLQDTGLALNPFGAGPAHSDPLLFKTYSLPRRWSAVLGARSALIIGRHPFDRASARLWLGKEIEPTTAPTIFPILCEITDDFGTAPRSQLDYLRHMAHQSARTWLTFLPLNPGSWFSLPSAAQQSLTALLSWHTSHPINLLQQHNLPDTVEAQVLVEEMKAILATIQPDSNPGEDELLLWLKIRPAGLQSTFILLDCPFETREKIRHAVSCWPALAEQLAESNVILKMFLNDRDTLDHVSNSDKIMIEWEAQQLVDMLNNRIKQATQGASFADLFNRDPGAHHADEVLAQAAGGSLGKLRELGQRVIEKHAANNAPEWDFDIVEQIIHDAV